MLVYQTDLLTIRELEPRDKNLLVSWLNDPLVLTYYGGRDRPHDGDLVDEHFYMEEDSAVRCLIEYENRPIGYIQFYEIEEEERLAYGYSESTDKIYGTDQFIGETAYWDQGIGKLLVTSMLDYLMSVQKADRVVMDPQQWNIRAIKCYERCGFTKVKELPAREMHEGELRDCWLMEYSRISKIREEERKYHDACYENYKLFEEGSWLSKPVKTVMDTLSYFDAHDDVTVLDLGCGVGRNSIPVAKALKHKGGKVVCVDILPSALTKLLAYSEQYDVRDQIETNLSDIGDYEIAPDIFDYIVAVSSLEHVDSEQTFERVLNKIALGTKVNGVNCLIVNANLQEIDTLTGEELTPLIELNLTSEHLHDILNKQYVGWEILLTTLKKLTFNIERNGRQILLKTDCLTYVVRKNTLIESP
jgi:RimJ/RimL family protein N-acetyltransferase/ubiquinone/menaquinone biosynthesis C-methylase UbiE